MFHWTNDSNLTRIQINVDTILFSNRQFDSSLIQPTLWFVWHVHMHNSLTDHTALPTLKSNFCSKMLKLRELFAFYTSRKFTLFTQHNTTILPHRKLKEREKNSLTHWKSDLIKLHFNLVPRSLQRTFEQFS